MIPPAPRSTLFPYTTLFRSPWRALEERGVKIQFADINEEDCTLNMEDLASKINSRTKMVAVGYASNAVGDRKSTRLNSSHVSISYAVFCLKKKKKQSINALR